MYFGDSNVLLKLHIYVSRGEEIVFIHPKPASLTNTMRKSLSHYFINGSSSSSYPVYPAHRKLRPGSGEGKTAATHTHKGERGQRSPPTRGK